MSRWSDWVRARLEGSKEGEALLIERKAELLGRVHGRVVEIGPGTGANMSCYRKVKGVSWLGVEPNHASLRTAQGEALPLLDASADAVVATYMLCSVESPSRVLSEVLRVLRPGGEFIFFEHVAAPRGTRTWWAQKLSKPIWGFFGSGCCPDLDIASIIREAKFREVHIDSFIVDRPIDGPHIAGFAVK